MSREAEKENGRGEKRGGGYRHLLDSDKWTEISISEWNHHWTSRVSVARMTMLFQVSAVSRLVCASVSVHSGTTHLNLSRSLTERPTTVHLRVLYSLTSSGSAPRLN